MNRRLFPVVAVLLCVFVPWVFFANIKPPIHTEDVALTETTSADEVLSEQLEISLLMSDGTVERLPLENYITRVVLREMPADFEQEALKAQAVVARTYTLRRLEGNPKHIGAAVCTNPACCQGYCTEAQYLQSGGTQLALDKVSDAVSKTAGMVLTYGGTLIEATYFSCSGGMTEDASAVWGADIPYLQATQSPGEEGAAHYTDTLRYSAEEFASALGVSSSTPADLQVREIILTDGGGVSSAVIGGKTFTGTELREKLNLNSTSFMISVVGDCVVITTKGFGHRVGMSQYGADAMAVRGSSFAEILQHYYQGTNLVLYSDVH